MYKPQLPGHWTADDAGRFLGATAFPHRLVSATPLRGGFWNDVFRLDTSGGRFVLKHYESVLPDSLYPNLPDQEYAALRRLSGLAVAPEPFGYWPAHKVLIYHFVDGEPWDNDFASVAALLRRKERASADGFRAVPLTPSAILAEGDGLFARCRHDEEVAACLAGRPAPHDLPPPHRLSLIHTDMGPTNLIGTGEALRLVDWQCPAAGDLAADIYSFLSPAFRVLNFREPLAGADIAHFLAGLAMPEIVHRYRRLRPYYSFRMLGYCAVRSQTADAPAVVSLYRRAIAAELGQ
jgi:thiamine kinase